MKKSLIASGAAAVALAAMPVVGVFAEPAVINTMTDNLTITVPNSCSIVNVGTDSAAAVAPIVNNYTATINNGQYNGTIGGNGSTSGSDSGVDVSCNDSTATWKLTAVGAGDAGYENKLHKQGAANGDKDINSGSHVESGATSNWDFKVTQTGNVATAADNFAFATWTPVPAASAEKDLCTGTGSTSGENAFSMQYSVYVSGTQDGGTYKGAVKYTLYNPAS